MKMTVIRNAVGEMGARVTAWAEIVADGVIGGPIALPKRARNAIGDARDWIKITLDPNLAAKKAWIFAAADADLESLKKLAISAPDQVDAMLPAIAFDHARIGCRNMTPLMAAIESNSLDCVEFLIPLSDLSTKTKASGAYKGGHTAMMQAALNGSPEIVDAMLRSVTAEQLNAKNGFGSTALLGAITFGRQAAAGKIIRDPRCDHQIEDSLGQDALMVAVRLLRTAENVGMVAPFASATQRERAFKWIVEDARFSWPAPPMGMVAASDFDAYMWACADELMPFLEEREAMLVYKAEGVDASKKLPKWTARMEAQELKSAIAQPVAVKTRETKGGEVDEKADQESGSVNEAQVRPKKSNRL